MRVAADWRPDGWLADFDHLTVQQAEEAVTATRDGLNALHRVQAVSESDAARAKAAELVIPVLVKRMEELGSPAARQGRRTCGHSQHESVVQRESGALER